MRAHNEDSSSSGCWGTDNEQQQNVFVSANRDNHIPGCAPCDDTLTSLGGGGKPWSALLTIGLEAGLLLP